MDVGGGDLPCGLDSVGRGPGGRFGRPPAGDLHGRRPDVRGDHRVQRGVGAGQGPQERHASAGGEHPPFHGRGVPGDPVQRLRPLREGGGRR